MIRKHGPALPQGDLGKTKKPTVRPGAAYSGLCRENKDPLITLQHQPEATIRVRRSAVCGIMREGETERQTERVRKRENGSRNVNRDKSQDTKEKEIGNSEGADPLPSSNTQDCVVECETCSLSGQHSRNGPVDESTGEPRAKSENRSIGTLVSCLI